MQKKQNTNRCTLAALAILLSGCGQAETDNSNDTPLVAQKPNWSEIKTTSGICPSGTGPVHLLWTCSSGTPAMDVTVDLENGALHVNVVARSLEPDHPVQIKIDLDDDARGDAFVEGRSTTRGEYFLDGRIPTCAAHLGVSKVHSGLCPLIRTEGTPTPVEG